jgi:photosystem II stability/assembly factor-like uncharacterized protein
MRLRQVMPGHYMPLNTKYIACKLMKLLFPHLNLKRYIIVVFLVAVDICNAQWLFQNSTTNNHLNDVSFTDSLHGWVVGNNGIIFHTRDSGNNWSPQISTVRQTLSSVSFCDTMNGWIVGDEGSVLTTSNGGETWRFIELDTSINILNTKVQCLSPSTAVIFNKRWEYDIYVEPRVWITSDTGSTWTEIASQPGYYNWWYDFHFATDSIGFIAGISGNAYEKLIVVKTNDGGSTLDTSYINWKVQGGFKRIYFKNRYEGWLLADSIYHSINSGVDWKGIAINNFNVSKDLVMFGDTGYVVQNEGKIFQTTDGGYTWNFQSLGIKIINKIDFINPRVGWAVGQYGTIAYTDNAGITSTNDFCTNSSSELCRLYQNYPNPFNPVTTIEFYLPKTSDVTLKIYNILGEEVATLVSDRLNAGTHQYEWSRSAGMASGVYLYRLEAGEFIETRKMILMR